MQICPDNGIIGCTYWHNCFCTPMITLKTLPTIMGMRISLLEALKWTCLYVGHKDYILLNKQPWQENKLSPFCTVAVVAENCVACMHLVSVLIWNPRVCVSSNKKNWGWTLLWPSHALSVSARLYALVKLGPFWLHLQHKPLNPQSLQCRKGHKEHMEGFWSLLVHGTDSWKNSGNFRKLDFF